ncbi:MAG TPA: hypothetical protein VK518_13415 [Puia sp.]|nr:hypothetical protein [Puia sp.]
MDSISLPVVAPAFERLKRSGTWLHLTAGVLILTHAVSHFRGEESHTLYFWCQLIISLDIFLLVLAGKDILRQLPKVNLFFRLVEVIFFLGIGTLMLLQGHLVIAIVHLSLSIGYAYLFYCEKRFRSEELLSFHHTGITIPGMPESRFLLWSHVNEVETFYDSIHISTSQKENLTFDLRTNLEFGQLEHIHQFCRFYLGK